MAKSWDLLGGAEDVLGGLPELELSVVVPVRGVEQTIGSTLEQLGHWIRRSGQRAEVVVVDDGSEDATDQAAAMWRKHFDGFQICRHGKRRGIGAAARTGMVMARGRWVLMADPELALLYENAETLLGRIAAGADVAVLSRRLQVAVAERPFLERAAETTFLAVTRLFVSTGVRDGLCGLMALGQRAGRRLAERALVDGPAYPLEWLALARTMGFHVAECPLAAPVGRRTSLLNAGNATGMLRDVWKTHRRLALDRFKAQPRASLLHETSFVKLDRTELAAGRNGQR
jgi:hypothetical protein